MSDYHILEASDNGKSLQVVFHFDTPGGTNATGLSYSTCLSQHTPFTSSIVPNLDTDFATEHTALVAGTKYEHTANVVFDTIPMTATNTDKENFIKAKWTSANQVFQARIVKVLQWWRYNGDVA